MFLFITLPSGRRLAYPFCTLITNRFGRPAVQFMDNALITGGWAPCNHGTGAYGGLVDREHCFGDRPRSARRGDDAARSRRLSSRACTSTTKSSCELPDGVGDLDEFKRLVEQLPEWAA